jgi:WD40 repeat protein
MQLEEKTEKVDLFKYQSSLNHQNKTINSFTFSQDGELIVSSSSDNKIIIWDLKSG